MSQGRSSAAMRTPMPGGEREPRARIVEPSDGRVARLRFAGGVGILLLSGWTGLAYEYLWSRRLIDLIGATSESSARVFGCFFVGLAAGALLSRVLILKRVTRLWLLLALAELAIVLLGVPLLTLHAWSSWAWSLLAPDRLVGWQGGALKLLLSCLLVVPPAVLMGLNLPLVARLVLPISREASRRGAWLYASNTSGGLLGLIAVPTLLFPRLGVGGALAVTMAMSGALCAAYLLMHGLAPAPPAPEAQGPPAPDAQRVGDRRHQLVAFVSGAAILSIEIIGMQMLDQLVHTYLYSSLIVLGCVVGLLAAGAWLAPIVASRLGSSLRQRLSLLLLLSGIATLAAPLVFNLASKDLSVFPRAADLLSYLVAPLGVMLATIGPTVLIGGMVFPSLFQAAEGDHDGARRTSGWAGLLAANGIGGFLGAELTNGALLPAFGFNTALGAIGLLYLAMAWLTADRKASRLVASRGASALCLAGGLALLVGKIATLPQVGFVLKVRKSILNEVTSGPEGVVAVVNGLGLVEDDVKRGNIMLLNNKYILGGDINIANQRNQAVLPVMLHPSPRRIGVIGLATGTTAGTLLAYESVQSVVAIEISRVVIDQARRHFSSANRGIFEDPRATIVHEDGRLYFAAARDRFDVVIGDLFVPSDVGATRLYSVEHFRAVRRSLSDGGMFCQWIAMSMVTAPEFHSIVSSMLAVFPKVYLFHGAENAGRAFFALIAFRNGDLELSHLAARIADAQAAGRFDGTLWWGADEIRARLLGVARRRPGEPLGQLNTLDNGWIEISATRSVARADSTGLRQLDEEHLRPYLAPFER